MVVLFTVWVSIMLLMWGVFVVVFRTQLQQKIYRPNVRSIDDVLNYIRDLIVLVPGSFIACLLWPFLIPGVFFTLALLFWGNNLKPMLEKKFFSEKEEKEEKEETENSVEEIIKKEGEDG